MLCYLPKNTTPVLQSLDASIIRMFKAGYRQRLATCLVEQFNRIGEAQLDINILQTIQLLSAAWDDVPPYVIFVLVPRLYTCAAAKTIHNCGCSQGRRHCWQCSGVIASQNKESFPSYEAYTPYLQYLQDSTSMSITLLLTTSTNSQQVNTLAAEFLGYDEDEAKSLGVVDIEEIIEDFKSVDNEDEDLEVLEDLYSPPPNL